MTTLRFAPSPTGLLHVGNIRTAVFNWLYARKTGGSFILRIDDTDDERSKPEYETAIEEDLAWLGLAYDRKERQSERFPRYEEAVAELKASGRLYPCYETPDELERKRKRQLARGQPPVYDRSALKLSDAEKAAFEAEGRTPHWRFKLDGRRVAWDDLVRGQTSVDTASLSDPVLIRADGRFLYTLPSVVDDIDFGVTHVVRGEDHVANSGAQIELIEALGGTPPVYAHHPLLTGAGGEGLSKRLGSLSVRSLREDGLEPMALVSFVAKLGTSDAIEPHLDIQELIDEFDFEKLGRAPARFDPEELKALNTRLLHMMPFERVESRLAERGIGGGAAFWEAARANLETFADVADWWRVVTGPVTPDIEDEAFAAAALKALPPEPWTEDTWGEWTKAVKAETGAKGRQLFMPLRKALTGLSHGPELKNLIPLMGFDRVAARLKGETA